MLSGLGVSLPVGNSDAGSYFNNEVLGAVDYGVRCLSLFHPGNIPFSYTPLCGVDG